MKKDAKKIILRLFYYCSFFCFNTLIVSAQVPSELFEKGNVLYEKKDFVQALNTYKKIHEQGYNSPELFLNMGNAAYKNGALGYAILYYEKGLKLSPFDDDLKYNLELSNQRVVDEKSNVNPLVDTWGNLLIDYTWISKIVSLVSLILGLSLSTLLMLAYIKRTAFLYILIFLLFTVSFLAFILSVSSDMLATKNQSGIILTKEISVKEEPSKIAETLFFLHQGSKTEIVRNDKDWLEIKFDGRQGWIKKKDIGII